MKGSIKMMLYESPEISSNFDYWQFSFNKLPDVLYPGYLPRFDLEQADAKKLFRIGKSHSRYKLQLHNSFDSTNVDDMYDLRTAPCCIVAAWTDRQHRDGNYVVVRPATCADRKSVPAIQVPYAFAQFCRRLLETRNELWFKTVEIVPDTGKPMLLLQSPPMLYSVLPDAWVAPGTSRPTDGSLRLQLERVWESEVIYDDVGRWYMCTNGLQQVFGIHEGNTAYDSALTVQVHDRYPNSELGAIRIDDLCGDRLSGKLNGVGVSQSITLAPFMARILALVCEYHTGEVWLSILK